jgi:hypothetical protein
MFGFGRGFELEDGTGDAYPLLDCGVSVFDMFAEQVLNFNSRNSGRLQRGVASFGLLNRLNYRASLRPVCVPNQHINIVFAVENPDP